MSREKEGLVMTYRKAELLLGSVIIARSTALLIVKSTLGDFSTFNIMAMRFVIASICLYPFVRKGLKEVHKETIAHGIVLGSLFFAIIAIELTALRLTDSTGTVSFIENSAIVMVPMAEAALARRLPHRESVVCALFALSGIGFLLMKGGAPDLSSGAIVCFCSATIYTMYIIVTDRMAHKDKPVVLGFITVASAGVLALAASLITETPRLPETVNEWAGTLLLAVICGSIGTALQPLAQKYVASEKACIFCALSPLSTCVLGWLFLNEWQGMTGVIGAVMILSAIILPHVQLPQKSRQSGLIKTHN